MTVALLKKRLPATRGLSDSCLASRLHEAGLLWMRRRKKTLVTADCREARKEWARWVLKRKRASLDRWVFVDGTASYLDSGPAEFPQTQRAALGTHVWRMANGSDALYADCVGPSAYWKAQGLPVRVWGALAGGRLRISVLPEGVVMNRWEYAKLIQTHFAKWFADHVGPLVVQDYEKCLRCAEPLAAFADPGMKVLEEGFRSTCPTYQQWSASNSAHRT